MRRRVVPADRLATLLLLLFLLALTAGRVSGIVQVGQCSDGSAANIPCDQESKICAGNPRMGCERHGMAYFCCGLLAKDDVPLQPIAQKVYQPQNPPDEDNNCDDKFKQCEQWARRGLCLLDMYRPQTKANLCPKSCKLCHLVPSKIAGQGNNGQGNSQGVPPIHEQNTPPPPHPPPPTLPPTSTSTTTLPTPMPTADPAWYDGFDMEEVKKSSDWDLGFGGNEKEEEAVSNGGNEEAAVSNGGTKAEVDGKMAPGLRLPPLEQQATTFDPSWYEADYGDMNETMNAADWDWGLGEGQEKGEKQIRENASLTSTSPDPTSPDPISSSSRSTAPPGFISSLWGRLAGNKPSLHSNEHNTSASSNAPNLMATNGTSPTMPSTTSSSPMNSSSNSTSPSIILPMAVNTGSLRPKKQPRKLSPEVGELKHAENEEQKKQEEEKQEEEKQEEKKQKEEEKQEEKKQKEEEKQEKEKLGTRGRKKLGTGLTGKGKDNEKDSKKEKHGKKQEQKQGKKHEEKQKRKEEDYEKEDNDYADYPVDDYDYEADDYEEEDLDEYRRNTYWEQFRRGMHGMRDGLKRGERRHLAMFRREMDLDRRRA